MRLKLEREIDIGCGSVPANQYNTQNLDGYPYLMSSNSPSGGMKLIDRSESNLPNRTH
jgi:hypothetical protein